MQGPNSWWALLTLRRSQLPPLKLPCSSELYATAPPPLFQSQVKPSRNFTRVVSTAPLGTGTMPAAMNYKHIYHAGNFPAAPKHVGLMYCLGAFPRKHAPFFVL